MNMVVLNGTLRSQMSLAGDLDPLIELHVIAFSCKCALPMKIGPQSYIESTFERNVRRVAALCASFKVVIHGSSEGCFQVFRGVGYVADYIRNVQKLSMHNIVFDAYFCRSEIALIFKRRLHVISPVFLSASMIKSKAYFFDDVIGVWLMDRKLEPAFMSKFSARSVVVNGRKIALFKEPLSFLPSEVGGTTQ